MTAPADGRLWVVLGASRAGKTAWTHAQVRLRPRVVVWDPKGEWARFPEFNAAESWGALFAAITDARRFQPTPARIAFVPGDASREGFTAWAEYSRLWAMAAPAIVVAEELPDVTGTAKAESGWGRLLRRTLGQGGTVYALSQSPAESDKTTLRNATGLHVGRLGWDRDREYAARLLDVSLYHVESLKPLEFLERAAPGEPVKRGAIRFRRGAGAYVAGRPAIVPARSASDPPASIR